MPKQLPREDGWELVDGINYQFSAKDESAAFPNARMEVQQNGSHFRLVYTRGDGYITYADLAHPPTKKLSELDALGYQTFVDLMGGDEGLGPSLLEVAHAMGTEVTEGFEVFEGEGCFNRKMRMGVDAL